MGFLRLQKKKKKNRWGLADTEMINSAVILFHWEPTVTCGQPFRVFLNAGIDI